MDKYLDLYRVPDYDFATFDRDMMVLDVGCGNGAQLEKLKARGCRAIGIEPDGNRVDACKERGISAMVGRAEKLPFEDATFDGVICKGVIPYTAPAAAFHEIARVLKPGAVAQFCYLSGGFYLRYLLLGPDRWLRYRLYGLRTLLNTWFFMATNRVLPGFLGDTIYQSQSQLRRYYKEYNFTLVQETPSKKFMGLPVFIYHTVRKNTSPSVPPAVLAEQEQEEVAGSAA
ncbi:MAG: class I SAM-dependent methyltransferase [Acidobacteriia bacterium]|nr:class I SAM-dependent methyltransferase [Terriglobia bacterium]